MNSIVMESDKIILRQTREEDLDFVLHTEQHSENSPFIGQWSREQHIKSILDRNEHHLIIEDAIEKKSLGYMMIAGIESPNKSIELRRLAIIQKGMGYGREVLRMVKQLAFNELKAHRLWLDVREHNKRAYQLYKSEGFVEEGTLRECVFYNGRYESIIVMSILEDEYRRGNSNAKL